MTELTSSVERMIAKLDQLESNQNTICERLGKIEKSVDMAAGAWMLAKYLVAVPIALWSAYEWFKAHVH